MRPAVATVAALAAICIAAFQATTPNAVAAPVIVARSDRLTIPAPKGGRTRPLVAIVAENDGAETSDFAIPFGVLKESGAADVRTVSTGPGPVQLLMSLKVRADQTMSQFDAAEPEGADIVIVPAQRNPKDPALAAWVKAQARKGAVVMSICEGARVLAHAGLLDGKRATTHWYALKGLEKAYPGTTWVRDLRYVQDGRIISTTGVSASIPASLALVEAIGGRASAETTAQRLGVRGWSAAHRTADYRVSGTDVLRILGTMAAVWTHEKVEAPLTEGVDEIALALTADAWGRSYRTKVIATHRSLAPVRSKRGLVIVPDDTPRKGRFVVPIRKGPAAAQLDAAIRDVADRYGTAAARHARLGLEYGEPGS